MFGTFVDSSAELTSFGRVRFAYTKWFVCVYVTIMLTAGSALCFILPPFRAPDEGNHFLRSFTISQGQFFAQPRAAGPWAGGSAEIAYRDLFQISIRGILKPAEKLTLDELVAMWSIRVNGQYTPVIFPNTAPYFMTGYVPQAIGIGLAHAIFHRAILHVIAGRLANLIAFTAVIALAMSIFPPFIPALIAFSALPMVLHLTASVSQDATIYSFMALYSVLLLRLTIAPPLTEAKAPTSARLCLFFILALLGITSLVLCLAKLPYLPIVILMPLMAYLRSDRKMLLFALGISAFVIASLGLDAVYIHSLGTSLDDHANPSEQLSYIFHNPTEFARVILRTFAAWGGEFARQMIAYLGWIDLPVPPAIFPFFFTVIGFAMLAVVLAMTRVDRPLLKRPHAFIIILGAIVVFSLTTVIFVCAAQYLIATEPRSEVVHLIQGRYFYPPVFIGGLSIAAIGGLCPAVRRGLADFDAHYRLSEICASLLLVVLVFSQFFVGCLYIDRFYLP